MSASASSKPSSPRWAELRPDDFRARRDAFPVCYLPIGLCEPHGHVAALGLDLIKAEYYCDQAATRFGGIVAPPQGYHIHESGFHAPWLAEVVGNENPLLAAIPPHVMLHLFLYQLRAFALAGFAGVIAVSGHSGGSQEDLRRVASAFTAEFNLPVIVKTDPEWIPHLNKGDHAGRYEISQLMAIRPDLVDMKLTNRRYESGSGGRLALGDDAGDATVEYGRTINEAIITAIGTAATEMANSPPRTIAPERLSYAAMERLWKPIYASIATWKSVSPWPGQGDVPKDSRWYGYSNPVDALK
jgi:creatinine amidohydrolase